ncbi:MAG TPA: choice-of-anchor D domain-containing protein [Terracidiphilus sp.]|jgi:CSLREA domain-containing protein
MIPSVKSVPSERSSLRFCLFHFPLILVCVLLPASVWAQQSTSSYNFGSQAIGAPATQSLTLTIPSSATLGGIAVSTQGAANLDFTNSSSGSCTVGTAYAASATCTVSVTFKPRLAGTRYGAVVLSDDSGNVLAMDYLQGSGTGAQVNFLPGTQSAVGSGFADGTESMTVDGSGNLYITDSNGSRVLKETWTGTGYTQSTFLSGTNVLSPVAVDGAGNLYMANSNTSQFQKWTWTGSAYVQTTIGSGLYGPTDAAVDGAGNVYIADAYNGRVLMETLSAGTYAQSVILTCGVYGQHYCPSSVAVDGIGNVYVTGWQSSSNFDATKILKMTPSAGGYTQSMIGSGMQWAGPVVVDGSGNLFVNSNETNQILMETPSAGSYIQSTVATSGLDYAWTIAVDGSGNLYIANNGANNAFKVDLADAPSLSFASTPEGSTSSDSPQTVQIENVGTAALNFTALSYPADFPEADGDSSACTSSTNLSPGLVCDLPIEFTPENGGPLSEDVTLTDNALNVAGAQQSIAVSGLSLSPTTATHFSVTTTATVVAGTPFSITVTALNSSNSTATTYNGTVSFTSSDPNFVNPGPLTLSSGVGQATMTLGTVGTQTITATDTTTSSLTGSGSFSVAAAPPPPAVIYAGTSANQNFGSVAIGSTSAATTFNFSIAAGTTVGSIGVVTQGTPNLDFASAVGSTCAATTYASTTTCAVDVAFKPRFADVRKGAVVFYSAANNTGSQLGSVPIYGVGTGPQIAYGPGAVVNVLSEIGDASLLPNGTAEDSAGDLFISDLNGNGVVEVPAGGHTWTEIYPAANGVQLNYPAGMAVDGAGNLFIASAGDASVLEVPAGGGAAIAIEPVVNGTGLYEPAGVAVDVVGDLFIGDFGNNRVVEVPAGNVAPILINPTVAGNALNLPAGMALDEAGDLFIADDGNSRVVEVPAGGGAATAIAPTVGGLGLSSPTQVAVDGAGDLFIADHGNNRVVEVPAGGGAATATQLAGQGQLNWMTLDDAGDQFISASPFLGQAGLVEVLRSQPPALSFPTPTNVGTTDTTDGTQTVQVQNIGNAALTLMALSYPADFPEANGDANACTGSTSLSAGQQCDVPIEFTPETGGPLGESVTLTDNALNVAGAQQSIAMIGLGVSPTSASHFSITTTTAVYAGAPFSITVTALTGSNQTATTYDGTVSFTSSDPGFVNPGPLALSSGVGQATVTLETVGTQTITATDTITSSLTGSGSFSVAAAPPQLNSIVITPSSSFATLPGASQQFTATGSYSGGSTRNLTSLVSWSSNNPTAVTIGASGLATAQAAGAATITASLDGVTSNAVTLTVDSAAQASIAVSSGSGQSAYEAGAFANPLVAVVKDTSGNAVQGVAVTFTAPSSGAGASFSNGAGAITIATDGNGLATEPVVANGTAGNYSVTATVAGISGSVSFSLTNMAGPAYPVYSVTTLVDDAVSSGTNCTDPTFKVTSCSLRDAITAANALPQTTLTPVTALMMPTIIFASSLNLSAESPGNYNITNGGTLTISANMNIVGPGANLLTLNGAGNQILNISGGTVFLSGLSLVDGGTPTSQDPYGNGGNGDGGGIYNNGTLAVTNSTFSGNSASGGNGNDGGDPEMGAYGGNGSGGGIYNNGTLTVTNSTFTGNSANGGSGYGDAGGGSGSGGGIENGGTLTVTNSTFSGNSTTGGVGGGGSDGDGDIGYNGGGGSGGGISNGSTLTVTNSTFSGNSATGGSGGFGYNGGGSNGDGSGGGIENGDTLTVADSTFSGNSANGGVGGSLAGGNAYGGGISNGGTLTVTNGILSGNSANGGGSYVNGVGYGAGIYNNLHANADSNVFFNNLTSGSEDDCNGCSTNTNAVSGNPLLAALGNYGGATQTMLPQPGSAAICAGAVGDIPVGVSTDQRGFARTNSTYEDGTACVDAGAVQTNYAMAFTTEPPAIVLRGQAISPAPAVALTESGAAATAVTSSVAMTDSDSLLSGTTTASFLSGAATFSNLLVTSVTGSDKLIATLALNPTINLTAQSTAFQAQTVIPAELTSPTPGTVLAGSSVTFTWTAGTGATGYGLWLGLNGAGSSDLYNSGITTATSVSANSLPTRGATIYARLFWEAGGVWYHTDYTYTEATGVLATMMSPTPGSTLGTSDVMFTWTAGTGVTHYGLWLGINGPGSSDLYASGSLTTTSTTVPSLPARRATIYARLYSEIDGVFEPTDYTYTETTGVLATMTTPTPASTLGTSNVTFTWTAGTGVTHYGLWLGISGPGSSDLYASGTLTTTSTTVPSLPAKGATIYARLYSEVNGVFEPTDYTYTEQ